MMKYDEMVRKAHEILATYQTRLGVNRQSDLTCDRVKSTGIRYFGGISIVRGYTLVGASGLVLTWCGRFGCGFYVDTTKSCFCSWRSYYLFTKPLSAFFTWELSRDSVLDIVSRAREHGFVLVDVHGFRRPLVSIPARLTASARKSLASARFVRESDYDAFSKRAFALEETPYDVLFSAIDKVSFDEIAFRAALPQA